MVVNKIAVIGSGTMGNGIAHVFAQTGFDVNLIDISSEALISAISSIAKNLDRQIKKERITGVEKEETLARITTFTKVADGVGDVDLVVEAASETLEVKQSIFKELDSLCKDGCILASNTSSISITKIGAVTQRAGMVIGMHFMNPVPVMKLIEIIRGFKTTDEVTSTIMALSEKIGKTPVEVNDYPGFIANRILMPMINEAIYSLHEGVAGVGEIDTVMKLGMAHPMGPLQLADFIGLDVCLSILNVLYQGFGNSKYAPCPLLVNMVEAGHLGIKSGNGFYSWNHGTKDLVIANEFKTGH